MPSCLQLRSILVLCSVLFAVRSLAAQDSSKAALKGVVTLARTGEPLPDATVSLFPIASSNTPVREANPAPAAQTTTGNNGAFTLEGIEAGAYRLTIGSNGFVRVDIPRIELKAGQIKSGLAVQLTATSAVSGRVSDNSGKPLSGVLVSLLRRTYNANGIPGFSLMATVRTNDLGEYRAFWISPGRYVVSATGKEWSPGQDTRYDFENAVNRGMNSVEEFYPQTFFPGVTDKNDALFIDLLEGAELRDINISLPRQQGATFRVRGRLVDAATGQPPTQAGITLSRPTRSGGINVGSVANWYDPKTGNFEIPNLPPGRYGVGAQIGEGLDLPPGIAIIGSASAAIAVVIENSNVDDITLTLVPPPVILGKVKIEGKLPSTTPVERLRVILIPSSNSATSILIPALSATVAPDASFKLSWVEGAFRIGMTNLPTGFYLKSAQLDNADVLAVPGSFVSRAALELTISAKAGEVNGVVRDDRLVPVAGVDAVLIPAGVSDRPELVQHSQTDVDGRFNFSGVAPGDYKVFAWERLEAFSYFDPEVMRKYDSKGAPVHVSEDSHEVVEVHLIIEGTTP